MKQVFLWMVVAASLAGANLARAETLYVVEISDVEKKVSREIKTSAELKDLKKTIEDEKRLFPKALELAKKEWDTTADKGAAPAAAGANPVAGAKPPPPPA